MRKLIVTFNNEIIADMAGKICNIITGDMMKSLFVVFTALVLLGCEQYPTNPSKEEANEPAIQIMHKVTDYVDATSTVDGVAANKTNVMIFEFEIDNFEATAIEILGTVVLEGNDEKEHAIRFWTDQILVQPEGTQYEFNTIDDLLPESTYTMIRSKFPPNEYAPFEGDMGKVKSLKFCEVWAYDELGDKESIQILSE